MVRSWSGKKILLGITGGIAAYKMHFLIRDLIKRGAEVQVVMTPDAEKFVTPLSISTLSKNPVYHSFYGPNGTWTNHVELGLWADLMLIAPCTANTLAKMANGITDNLLLAVYRSAKCPVLLAPAMDLDMYAHPTTTDNLKRVESFGNIVIPAGEGELASGLIGKGRMAEPATLLKYLEDRLFSKEQPLKGKKILITAGPTYEAIDPVRFIGNHSSGKMGFCLAEEAAARGAEVLLISGPTALTTDTPGIRLRRVTSAQEMHDAAFQEYDSVDAVVMSAAVADYRPKAAALEKIKKNEDDMSLDLVKNPDILREMGSKKSHQVLVGFALETQNEEANARQKLEKKNLDMIVLNSLRDAGAGFQKDTNRVRIFKKDGEMLSFELKSKEAVAADIVDALIQELNKDK